MELPTYTNIWRIEKRLYKLYDFRLPMPLPVGQIAVFAAIAVPYVVLLKVIGLPFSHTLLWLYVLPPAALAWLITRPVLEGKRLPELVHSQVRYLSEPRTWCRMAPLAEKEEITVVARVWRRVDIELAGDEIAAWADAEPSGAGAAEVAPMRTAELASPEAAQTARAEAGETAGAGAAEDEAVAPSPPAVPAASERPEAPPPPVERPPQRSALVRHLPTGPITAWPKAPSRAAGPPPPPASPARDLPGQAARVVPAPPAPVIRETPGRPARAVPAPPVRETSRPAARAAPEPVRGRPVPPVRNPPAPSAGDIPSPPAPTAPAAPAPPARGAQDPAARVVSAPGAPPPRSRPVVTVTGDQYAERPIRMVERALGNPAARRATGWRDRVVVVPGGHRPGQPDQMQRDRTRARLPLPGGHRVVVLGCTVGAGQTVTTMMTGELLTSLRDDQVAVLDLNPGPRSLAERARAVPALTKSRPPAPTRLEVVTRETAPREAEVPGAPRPGEDPEDATKIFELLSARYPLTLADPGAAVVPRVLAAASQLILVSPASQDAASSLATTREWLEAHGHAGLAEEAIIVLNGVSRHTLPHVEQAEALARGRCRAIVRVPWDDHLRKPEPQRAAASSPGTHPAQAAGPLGLAALQAYTALAGLLVASLADLPDQPRIRP